MAVPEDFVVAGAGCASTACDAGDQVQTPEQEDEATPRRWGPLTLWTGGGYGWKVDVGRRVRWSSTGATTRAWPHFYRGADEHCNRSVTLHAWPLGHLDVWWEPRWRTATDGPCKTCRTMLRDAGLCEACGSSSCLRLEACGLLDEVAWCSTHDKFHSPGYTCETSS